VKPLAAKDDASSLGHRHGRRGGARNAEYGTPTQKPQIHEKGDGYKMKKAAHRSLHQQANNVYVKK